ncbi:hypothetical protein ABT352_16395 [Streptosporangium sp. NPDC000563]|uniref:hypothetical protein n=1 Tax=unclassified Streptosporangium TaxID=2632669 RepID=UPI003321BE7D
MKEKEERAARVYERTSTLATGNVLAQGASGFFGGGANLVVDVIAIPFYIDLWNDVRSIYGRGHITGEAAKEYLKPNIPFLAQDLLWDKLVGSIPIVGIPFNIAFAKALTWRLGAWFGMLSAIGGDSTPNEKITASTMELTRRIFPSLGDTFSFKAPDRDVFVSFVASVDGLTHQEAQNRAEEALRVLRGEKDTPSY